MNILIYLQDKNEQNNLVKALRTIESEKNIYMEIYLCKELKEAEEKIKEEENYIDLIIFDIVDSNDIMIDLSQKLRKNGYDNDVLFLSNCEDLVFKSFSAEPINYIMQDEIDKKLKSTILKSYRRRKDRKQEMISFSFAGETRNIEISKIISFESVGRIISMRSIDEGEFKFYTSLKSLEEICNKRGFLRVHKGFIIAKDKVLKVEGDTITMIDGSLVYVGRLYRKLVENTLTNRGN